MTPVVETVQNADNGVFFKFSILARSAENFKTCKKHCCSCHKDHFCRFKLNINAMKADKNLSQIGDRCEGTLSRQQMVSIKQKDMDLRSRLFLQIIVERAYKIDGSTCHYACWYNISSTIGVFVQQ